MKHYVATILILLLCCTVSHGANLLPNNTTYIPQDALGIEKITNGSFSAGATGWTGIGVNGYSTDSATLNGLNATGNVSQGTFVVAGNVYYISGEMVSRTGGSAQLHAGSGSTGTSRSLVGVFGENLLASGNNIFYITGTTFTGSLDNISCKVSSYAINTKSFYSSGWIQNIAGAVISGDTAGVFSIISGPDINGKAYKIANTGSVDVVVTLTPSKSLTVGRSYRPIVIAKRTVGSGTPTFKLTGGTAVNITSSTFVPLAAPAKATNTTDKPTFTVPAGCTIQFYQPKLLTLDDIGGGIGKTYSNFNFSY